MASISIRCPTCSATEGVVRNGKSTAGHQRYLCSHCRKTWQISFTYTASQPGTHQKIIDMAMNGVGAVPVPALWALASTRFYGT
ncbi:IS1 family transposase [Klebsiella pneumoniae]|uniref:IS1 family transposase n=1 Tax=Klebsiella pneumoniae TaxID=573 RepID=UPI00396F511A